LNVCASDSVEAFDSMMGQPRVNFSAAT